MENRKPVHELKLGSVKAAIWENKSEKTGMWHSVTITRVYRQGEAWKRSSTFGPNELPLVSKVADMASLWIQTVAGRSAILDGDAATLPNV